MINTYDEYFKCFLKKWHFIIKQNVFTIEGKFRKQHIKYVILLLNFQECDSVQNAEFVPFHPSLASWLPFGLFSFH